MRAPLPPFFCSNATKSYMRARQFSAAASASIAGAGAPPVGRPVRPRLGDTYYLLRHT